MHRVSSNSTLFYKIFIPTFWIVFFGAFTVVVMTTPYNSVGAISRRSFQIMAALFFLSGLGALYLTLMQLKRVEMGEDDLYVTNYFRHFRYPYHNVEKIEISRFLFFSTASIYLKNPGSFGRRMTFIPSMFRLNDFLNARPDLKARLLEQK